MNMKEEYIEDLRNPSPEEEKDDDAAVPSKTDDVGGNKSEMAGSSDQFQKIRDKLLEGGLSKTVSIVGMPGIGKTTLAAKIFEDPLIKREFECRAFVTIGQTYQLQEKLKAILAQVNPDSDKMLVEGDEKLDEYLCRSLKGRKYLIVFDDVWNSHFWTHAKIKFPDEYNGSAILATTRLGRLAESISPYSTYNMRFLNKEESWNLLCRKVFAKEFCPPQLEKAGKKIAENCEGLPLLILTVADLLSKVEKTPEYWKKVAADKENSIYTDAYDQISKVLYPSYNYLSQHLKACFLYMGAFPQNYDVRLSKLINLWSVEGFLENPFQSSENFGMGCLNDLVASNLVLIRQRSFSEKRVKDYGVHFVFWHLCKREATNNKFLHVLNSYADCLAEGIESQRRLSIYKNILFSIKDVYHSMASMSTARSLFCPGAHHKYQVPICFGLRLLRVLDALTIHCYEFPMEVVKLVHLRYLALTCNGNLPPSISKLWCLQFLIVHQHLSIISKVAESYLPMELWDLQELKYLQIMGRNLPDPPRGIILPNLLTLLDVGAHSCSKVVLESIPNLDNLSVQIELAPHAVEPLSSFDHISFSTKLGSLQYIIMNPTLRSEILVPPPFSFITPYLQKLTLSGLGYPWKDLKKIAELPYLKVLKLQSYAFRGKDWYVEKGFFNLTYLLIEDNDLVQWTVGEETFRYLYKLTIKNCYKLQEISRISFLKKIELVDCNSSAVACAKQMEANYRNVYVSSSWDDGNIRL